MIIDVIVLILNLPMKITTDHLVGICLVHFLEPSTHKKSQIGIAQPSRLTSLKFLGITYIYNRKNKNQTFISGSFV